MQFKHSLFFTGLDRYIFFPTSEKLRVLPQRLLLLAYCFAIYTYLFILPQQHLYPPHFPCASSDSRDLCHLAHCLSFFMMSAPVCVQQVCLTEAQVSHSNHVSRLNLVHYIEIPKEIKML